MRVCFGLWHLNGYRGTQTWTVAAARAMKTLGHEVSLYTLERGRAAMRLMPEFPVYSMSHIREVPKQDVLVCAQPRVFFECKTCGIPVQPDATGFALDHEWKGRPCTGSGMKMKQVLPRSKHRVYVCHGIKFWQDAPLKDKTSYIAVSEEVKRFLRDRGVDSTVILQPVETDRYTRGPELRETHPRALSFSQDPAERSALEKACEEAGVELVFPPETEQWDIVALLHSVDVVIGTGRGLCEGMACGRAAIVCGTGGCDGLVTPFSLDLALSHNLSGRATKGDPATELPVALRDYDPALGTWSRRVAEKTFGARAIAEHILEVACSR